MNTEGFFDYYREKMPSTGDSVIILHDGQQKKAKYIEYMNGVAYVFQVEETNEIIGHIVFWKPAS